MNGHVESSPEAPMPIAIVGMSCRLPGEATNPDTFWDMILNGRNALTEVPKSRYNIDAFYHPFSKRTGCTYTRGGYFLKDDIEVFDAPFFSITALEARAMDPQQRLALELSYEGLENAEIIRSCEAIVGGVNVILMPELQSSMSYMNFLSRDNKSQAFDEKANGFARGEGTAVVILKPLEKAIQDGDVIRAVIRSTGVNQDGKTPGITMPSARAQEELIRSTYASAGLDFKDTQYVEAHGTGAYCCKPSRGSELTDKQGTPVGDPIECSAIGATLGQSRSKDKPLFIGSVKTNIGHTETASGVASLIKAVYMLEKATMPPNLWFDKPNPQILFQEWNLKVWSLALCNVYCEKLSVTQVPTEILSWPTEGQRRVSVNSFGYGGTNSHCILDDALHFLKSRGLVGFHNSLERSDASLRKQPSVPLGEFGTNSISTNSEQVTTSQSSKLPSTNLVTEIAKENSFERVNRLVAQVSPPRVLVWSSSDEQGAAREAHKLASYVASKYTPEAKNPERDNEFMDRLAFTLCRRRSKLPWKSFVLASNIQEAQRALDTAPKALWESKEPPICFLFTGQGAQWYGMGRELLVFPVFRSSLEDAALFFRSEGAAWDLIDELLAEESQTRINEPIISHPACVALQVALVDLLVSWNIQPSITIGHSSGEVPAAYARKGISRESAWRVAYHRGRLAATITRNGGMLAVGVGEEEIEPIISQFDDGKIHIGCFNSPTSLTLSGDPETISATQKILEAKNIFNRRLAVTKAYHTHHMNEVRDRYLGSLEGILAADDVNQVDVQMFSSVTGGLIEPHLLDQPIHWMSNLLEPVKFRHAMEAVIDFASEGQDSQKKVLPYLILEIGPHSTLQLPVKQILLQQGIKESDFFYTSLLIRKNDAVKTALTSASLLFQQGCQVDLNQINSPNRSTRLAPLVDIPPFSWNHATKYWHESRSCREFRFRKHPRHDFLGARSEHSSSQQPSWKNFIQLSNMPWVEHHRVQFSVLYPFSGMLVMAIEALRQTAIEGKEIKGIRFRDVSAETALVISRTEGIETKFQLRPYQTSSRDHNPWKVFTISSRDARGTWTQHCSGLVIIEYHSPINPAFISEEEATSNRFRDEYNRISKSHGKQNDIHEFYRSMADIGLEWSGVFKNLIQMSSDNHEAHCVLEIPDTKIAMPEQFESDHLVHPATLDGVFQMILPAFNMKGVKLSNARVPRFVENVYICAKLANKAAQDKLYGFSKVYAATSQQSTGSIVVSDKEWQEPLVVVEGLKLQDIGDHSEVSSNEAQDTSKIGLHQVWDVDLDLLSSQNLTALLTLHLLEVPEPDINILYDLELAAFVVCKRVLRSFRPSDVTKFAHHHRLFFEFIEQQRELATQGKLPYQSLAKDGCDWLHTDEEFDRKLFDRVSRATIDGKLLCRVAAVMNQILEGRVKPLQVLKEDGLLQEYYNNYVGFERVSVAFFQYVRHAAHKRPLRILEVGAGTGATTRVVLSALGGNEASKGKLVKYTFTDISSGFFEAAAKEFAEWSDFIDYKVFDIENDAIDQGFEPESYDIVIASNVIHACSSIEQSLAQCRKVLRPGGALLLGEVTTQVARMSVVFGLLPGWWSGANDNRNNGPKISEADWHYRLQKQGFGGVFASFHDDSREVFSSSLIVSTAEPRKSRSVPQDVLVILPPSVEPPVKELARLLSQKLTSQSSKVEVVQLHKIGSIDLSEKVCIVAVEAENPLLYDMSSHDFESVKHLILHCSSCLWLTKGAAENSENPESSLITGLARSIRGENPSARLATLDLDPASAIANNATCETILETLTVITADMNRDWEFAVRSGMLRVPRLFVDQEATGVLDSKTAIRTTEIAPFGLNNRALALEITNRSALDGIQFGDCNEYYSPLGEFEVEIQVKAIGVNYKDVLIMLGEDQQGNAGFESSGVVSRVGKSVDTVAPGDRVVSVRPGSYRTYVRNHEQMVKKIPDSMSFEEAASLMVVNTTACHALFDMARLQKHDKILIHAGAGGLGQAAIAIAKHVGAEIFVTTSNEVKKRHLMETYGIDEQHILNSRDLSFLAGIKRLTNGKGVDVVLNSLSGEALQHSLRCLAPFGRFIEAGTKDMASNSALHMAPFLQNISFYAANMFFTTKARPAVFSQIMSDVMEYHAKSIVRHAKPLRVMKLSQIVEAFRTMQAGNNIGKIVLTLEEDDMVPVAPPRPKLMSLPSDATYLIPGGLGGLGRSFATWLASKGAKYIAFISPSGATKLAAREFLEKLNSLGVQSKAFKGDLGDVSQLSQILDTLRAEFPPIRGVVTFAMQLQDVFFENMTYENFRTAIRPKVLGTKYLHELLPKDLDFFVSISSMAGTIGTRGQGNYNAGNVYQDALARHRHAIGLNGYSIGLGYVTDAGFVQRNDIPINTGWTELCVDDLLRVLEASFSGSLKSETIVGLATGGQLRQRGDEDPFWFRDGRFDAVRVYGTQQTESAGLLNYDASAADEFDQKLAAAETLDQATSIVCDGLVSKLARSMMMTPEEIDTRRPANSYGADSLVAVEVRTWVITEARSVVSVFDILGSAPLVDLARSITLKSKLVSFVE
ncbi:hypothetical protein QQS21_005861 [Conoideocrella luteorostrata]|uniref:Polyketide synthase n=1 Tax=Conoideocrella luteorostrata TaxID=1105319 RepID=A0AAJ0CP00_9HYPO|nr:hypothetical protein QQS21_005861 [Conoideocrella luteorostrata]